MKRIFLGILIVAGLSMVSSCDLETTTSAESKQPPTLTGKDQIARGKYLVTIAGCNDCHSPKVMTTHGPQIDTTRILSGHPMGESLPPFENNKDWLQFNMGLTAFVGPWGVSYAANLTPDDTGIGNWKFDQFKKAIRKGLSKGLEGSRPLLPPMPWEMYKNMTDEDLEAVFAYLKSLPAINNRVPTPQSPDHLISKK